MKRFYRTIERSLWSKLTFGDIKEKLFALLGIILFLIFGGTVIGIFALKMHTGDALWWSWTHVLDPGFLGDDKDDRSRQLFGSLFSTMGLVLIGGTFITLAEEAAKRTVNHFMSGHVPKDIFNHTVIAGNDPRKLQAFIKALPGAPPPEKILIVLPDQESRTQARNACGDTAAMIVGRIWEKVDNLNLFKAERIVILENFGGDTGDMFKAINTIYSTIEKGEIRLQQLKVYAEVNDMELVTTLRRAVNKIDGDCKGVSLHILNIANVSARLALRTYPLDCCRVLSGSRSRVTIVIEGWTKFAQALFWQALWIGHYLTKPTRIMVCHPDARRIANDVLAIAPGLNDDWCRQQLVDVTFFTMFNHMEYGFTVDDLVTYAICLENSNRGFSHALQRQETPFTGLKQIYLELPENSGYREMIQKIESSGKNKDTPKLIAVGPTIDAIDFEEKLDKAAKNLHARYLKQRMEQNKRELLPDGSYKSKSDYDWSELDEIRRSWNRASVDHIEVKLRALADLRKIDNRPAFDPTTGILACDAALLRAMENIVKSVCYGGLKDREILSKIEHDRWSAEKIAEGWTYAEVKDENRKQSPYLQPYKLLDKVTKGYDREAVVAMLKDWLSSQSSGM